MIFILGTDTGVGKTLLTALMLEWLRSAGVNALAIKPFVSGGLADVRVLSGVQSHLLGLDDLAPYRYRQPLAPAVAAQLEGRVVRVADVAAHVARIRRRCDCLLVEGCGGVLSPLGIDFSSLDLLRRLGGHVVLVARNQVGAINQVLLSVRALEEVGAASLRVVLMDVAGVRGPAARTNPEALRARLDCGVITVPFLGENACRRTSLRRGAKFLQKSLAGLVPSDTVSPSWKRQWSRQQRPSKKRVP